MLIGSYLNAYEIFRLAHEKHEPVVFPTDTIYGIGAPLSDETANRKIYDIKGREKDKPFPVLVSSLNQAEELAVMNGPQKKITEKLWPGAFTFIMKAKPHVDGLYTKDGNIAIRMPQDEWLRQLIEKTGPLSATSANLSHIPYDPDIKHTIATFRECVGFFVAKCTNATNSSTIIDITSAEPKIIRGEINLYEILSDK